MQSSPCPRSPGPAFVPEVARSEASESLEAPRSEASEDDLVYTAEHIQVLKQAISQEWLQFHKQLDFAVAQHFRAQEELFSRCLGSMSSFGSANGDGYADAPDSLMFGSHPPSANSFQAVSTLLAPPSPTATSSGFLGTVSGVDRREHHRRKNTHRITLSVPLSASNEVEVHQSDVNGVAFPASPKVQNEEAPVSETPPDSRASQGSQRRPSYRKGDTLGFGGGTTLKDLVESTKNWVHERSLWPKLARRCSGFLDWWEALEEPTREGAWAGIITGRRFETLCASVIIANALMSFFVINQSIAKLEDKPSPEFAALEYFFLSFFTLELAVKLQVHRLYYFCNDDSAWNIFDFTLVMFSLLDLAITTAEVAGQKDDQQYGFLRAIRILRMAKVLRGLRVMRFFSELRLMLNSLLGSLSSLLWSIAMMALIFYIFALVFVQGAAQHMILHKERDDMMMQYFGSVDVGMMTLYQACTGGEDWHWFLETVSAFDNLDLPGIYYYGFIFFIAFSQIALLNILTAIFVQRAMKLAQPDRETQALEKRNKDIAEIEELRRIMNDTDQNRSGTLSLAEFSRLIKKGKLGAQLSVLGLDIEDAQLFFGLVAAGLEKEEIEIDVFVDRCMRMRGSASCIDMQFLKHRVRSIARHQKDFQDDCLDMLRRISDRLAESALTPIGTANLSEAIIRNVSGLKPRGLGTPRELPTVTNGPG